MSNVHIDLIEDTNGDLVDILYWHHGCLNLISDDSERERMESNGWPAPEALDYTVTCEGCNERIYEVPLTAEGEATA